MQVYLYLHFLFDLLSLNLGLFFYCFLLFGFTHVRQIHDTSQNQNCMWRIWSMRQSASHWHSLKLSEGYFKDDAAMIEGYLINCLRAVCKAVASTQNMDCSSLYSFLSDCAAFLGQMISLDYDLPPHANFLTAHYKYKIRIFRRVFYWGISSVYPFCPSLSDDFNYYDI